MQRKLLAVAVLASLPLVASAQSSVVVYGLLDASVAREDSGSAGGSRTLLASGNQQGSRIGFRGVEDLGNGLKALFVLEAGTQIDTGAADAVLFGRRSVVGLQGSFGTVTLGREYTPINDVARATDIFGHGSYGSNLSSFGSGKLTRRISNSVNYRSASVSGFKFGAAYGLSVITGIEMPTGPSQNLAGVSAEYTMGGFYVGAGYHTLERITAGDDKELIVGAAYKIGNFELNGNYMNADIKLGAEYEQTNLGIAYTMDANKFMLQLTRNELSTGGKGKGLSFGYAYSLSKRTNLYAAASKMSNNNLGTFGITPGGLSAIAAGKDPLAYTVGVRHLF